MSKSRNTELRTQNFNLPWWALLLYTYRYIYVSKVGKSHACDKKRIVVALIVAFISIGIFVAWNIFNDPEVMFDYETLTKLQKQFPEGTSIAVAQTRMQQMGYQCQKTDTSFMEVTYLALECTRDESSIPGKQLLWVSMHYQNEAILRIHAGLRPAG